MSMQQRKQVLFIADSLDNAHKFQQVLSNMDVEVTAGSSVQFRKLLAQKPACDLVIYEVRPDASDEVTLVEQQLLEDGGISMLIIVDESMLGNFRLPVQIKSDFVVHGATQTECAARIRQLLWPGNESSTTDYISIDNMTINLATYQVQVGGEPLDLTYLEYALLAFLVTHPGRTYSRDALLRRVWGFDYYGGSRTVDVHVRRVRAKLGPDLAQRLQTVRGVGYLWSA
jgi:DNA-binding response OmpR family regulator